MKFDDIVTSFIGLFKQKCLEFGQGRESLCDRELSPGDYKSVSGALRELTYSTAAVAIKDYMESFDPQANSIIVDGESAFFKETSRKSFHVGFGVVEIQRRVYRRGGKTVVPLDVLFDVEDGYFMPDIREALLHSVATVSPGELVENLAKFHPSPPSATAVKRLVAEEGALMEESRSKLSAATSLAHRIPDGVEALVVSMDGASPRVRLEEQGIATNKSEFKIGMAGTVGVYGPAEADKDGVLRRERLVSNSFARMPSQCYPEFKEILDAEARMLSEALPPEVARILLMDGATHLWKHVEWNPVYGCFRKLVDFFHASEHLHLAAETIFGVGMQGAKAWEESWKKALLEDDDGVVRLIRSMEYYASKRMLKSRRKILVSQIGYFKNNKDRMSYASFRRDGLPIGSGPVEACCKTLIKTRMCRTGMSWKLDKGQAVLTLRGYRKSGTWDIMWKAWSEIRKKDSPIIKELSA